MLRAEPHYGISPNASLEPAPSETTAETDPMPRNTKLHRNAEVDSKDEKRSNATHASTTDPDTRLHKKSPGTGAMLCFIGHALMENRNGLIVPGDLTQADGHAERTAALDMVHRHSPGSTRRLTLGADKGYDAGRFVSDLRKACLTPHVAQKVRIFQSMADPPGMRVTPCPRSTERRSKRRSAGLKPSAAWHKLCIAASSASNRG
jgi:hypothetical protein